MSKFATCCFAVRTNMVDEAYICEWSLCKNAKTKDIVQGTGINSFISNLINVGPVYIQDLNFVGHYILNWLDSCDIPYILPDKAHNHKGEYYTCIYDITGTIYKIAFKIGKFIIELRNSRLKLVNDLDNLAWDIFGRHVRSDKTIQVSDSDYVDEQSMKEYSTTLWEVLHWYLKFGRQLTISGDVIQEWRRLDSDKAALYNSDDMKPFTVVNNETGITQLFDPERDIRKSYRGGVCWTDPKCVGIELGHGYVIDMHSIYLYVQYNYEMPYGKPEYAFQWCTDRYQVGRFIVTAKLKPNGFPCISCNDGSNSVTNEALDQFDQAELWLNKFDLELLYMNYDIESIRYTYGWVFKTTSDVFKNFIDTWWERKRRNDKNPALRAIAKAFAVNSYGKFGLKPKMVYNRVDGQFIPMTDENGILIYNKTGFSYVPVAACITSIARYLIINYACKCRDEGGDGKVVAIDTDAVHWIGKNEPKFFKKSKELGQFDIEAEFDAIKHIGIKQYAYKFNNKVTYKLSGANDEVKEALTWDTFNIGTTVHGKTIIKHIGDGVIRTFTKYKLSGGV